MITLPDQMSVAGIKARLFLCECPAPSDHSYTPDDAAEAINLMDVVIRNRVANPRPFMATGPSVLAVVQARGAGRPSRSQTRLPLVLASRSSRAQSSALRAAEGCIIACKARLSSPRPTASCIDNIALSVASGVSP